MSADICRWLFLLTWIVFANSKELRVVCYYTNWSVYRPGQAKFSPQNINPYLCTHLIYAFGGFTKENTLKPFDKYQDIEKGGYAKFTGLKTYNKNLKTMLAIGGWNEGSSRFSPMVASAERRKELVKNAIKFLRQNHFDGLDLDWEYPSFRDGGKSRDRDNYAKLVQELREEFDRESEKTGRPRLLLTMAVPAGIEYINKGYDVPKLTKYLDWMNILSYDYHSAFEPAVNHHAPLYSLEEASEYNYDAELNIDYTIQHYLEMGAERSKLVLGIPTYGRSYTLFNPDANEIGSPADGPGDMGDATRENGYLAYYEICENVKSQDWEVVEPNPKAMGPYAYKDNQWVGYDDDNIARKKAQYVAENGLGGIMFWSIDNDDFRGNCHGKPYPIIEAAKEALVAAYGLTDENLVSPPAKPIKSKTRTRPDLNKATANDKVKKEESVPISITGTSRRRRIRPKSGTKDKLQSRRQNSRKTTETTETSSYSSLVVTPSYTTPAPPSTPDQGGVFKCEDEGFYPHPKDCKKYYWCLSGPGELGIIAHQFTCPAGLYFNKAADSCDYTRNVLCNTKLSKPTTTTSKTTDATTKASTTTPTVSTSRVPPKITAATSRTTLFRTTSSTTEASNYDDEYEYYDDEDPEDEKNSEEDPKVIKELLDLIKKAGGIEELEKQLKIQEDGSASISSPSDATTPPSISKSLVQRVLGNRKNTYNTINRNSSGPQNKGLHNDNEKSTKDKSERGRPQYTTITRQRNTNTNDEDEENDDKKDEIKQKEKKAPNKPNQLEYVNIRRGRVSTTTDGSEEDLKKQLDRNKILGEEETDEEVEDLDDDEVESDNNDEKIGNKKFSTPQYVNIRRQRPSTAEESATTSKYTEIRRRPATTEESVQNDENETSSNKPTHIRRGSTTTTEATVPAENEKSTIARRRGTTTAPPATERTNLSNNLLSKYKTISRLTTTEASTSKLEKEDIVTDSRDSKLSSDSTTVKDIVTTTETKLNLSEQQITSTNLKKSEKNDSLLEDNTTDNKISFESNSENSSRTPLLFEPRPFSISTRAPLVLKPITETTTVVAKVSELNSRFRQRLSGVSTTENSFIAKQRTRKPSRFNQLNTTPTSSENVQEQTIRSTVNPTVRARKRFSTTTDANLFKYNEPDLDRNYRPSELADLSSLTAVDFASVKGFGRFGAGSRQRRPRPSTTTKISPEGDEETLKTSSRTLPIARKLLEGKNFNRNRGAIDDQINSSSDLSTTHRVRKLTTPTIIEATTEKQVLKTRRIIRRFRPTSTANPTLNADNNIRKEADNNVNLFNRRRLPRPSVSTFNTQNLRNYSQNTVPLRGSLRSGIITTTAATVSFNASTVASITISNSSNSDTISPVFITTSTEDFEEASSNNLLKDLTNQTTRLPYVLERNENILQQSENSEEASTEEEENIKLSESNIRENNDVNNGNIISEDGKTRKKFLKRIKSKTNEEDSKGLKDNRFSTEPNIIIRTRKIIRKLTTTESIPVVTSTTELIDNNNGGRRRKVIRRFRPTSTEYPLESKASKNEENKKVIERPKYKTLVRSTTVPAETEINSNSDENKDEKRIFLPKDKLKYNFRKRNQTEEDNYEKTVDNNNEEEEEEVKSSSPKYKTIFRPIIQKNQETNKDEDTDDENNKLNTTRYRIYRPNILKQDRPTQENDKEERQLLKPPIGTTENLNQNANTDNEEFEDDSEEEIKNKSIDKESNLHEYEENEDNTEENEPSVTHEYPKLENNTIELNDTIHDEENITEDYNTTTSSTTPYRNIILERQRNRPVFTRPSISKQSVSSTNLELPVKRPTYKFLARTSTTSTTSSLEENIQRKTNKFTPRPLSRSTSDTTTYNVINTSSTTPTVTVLSNIITTEIANSDEVLTTSEEATTLEILSETTTPKALKLEETTLSESSSSTDTSTVIEELRTIANTESVTENNSETADFTNYIFNTTVESVEGLTESNNLTLYETTTKSATTDSTINTNNSEVTSTSHAEIDDAINYSTTEEQISNNEVSVKTTTEFEDTNTFSSQLPDDLNTATHEEKLTTTTPAYQFKSTLKSIQSRPKFFVPKKLLQDERRRISSTTEGTSTNTGSFRLLTPNLRTTTSASVRNNFLRKYNFANNKNRFINQGSEDKDNNKEEVDNSDEKKHYEENREEVIDNQNEEIVEKSQPNSYSPLPIRTKPPSFLFRKTTESPQVTNILNDINEEAVKNRNKNLFSKKRKMNTPFPGTAQEKSTTIIQSTTESTSSQIIETTESLTTLHHVFAETQSNLDNLPTTINPASTDERNSSGLEKSKIERLIEVNRIVEVHAKEENVEKKENKTLDKIGAINRVTVIKVVDSNSTELNPEENIISSESTTLQSSSKSTISLKLDDSLAEVATIKEITAKDVGVNSNSPNNLYARQDKKYEIYGESKVLDYSQISGKNSFKSADKLKIIDGPSLINIITPRPAYSTEASTIALEGLFQTDSPQLHNVYKHNSFNNDELLETEHTRFVNVRVLEQDTHTDKSVKDDTSILPIKILKQDDFVTMKAKVVEVTPRTKNDTIKIVPIKVEMSRKLLVPNN